VPFLRALRACQAPTAAAIRYAMETRKILSEPGSDFFTYLVGFTHFAEGEPLLPQFGIRVDDASGLLYDTRRRTLHAKVLVLDLRHRSGFPTPAEAARQRRLRLFRNHVRFRASADAPYYPRRARQMRRLSRAELLALVPGLREDVVTLRCDLPDARQVACHVSGLPVRNTVENLPRLFHSVSAVVADWDDDPQMNTSVRQLRACPQIWPQARRCPWYIVASGHASVLQAFLRSIAVTDLHLLDAQGGPDLIDRVVHSVRERLPT
jgi:hypothetical protein